jgi:uncharacterized OB-fold protein
VVFPERLRCPRCGAAKWEKTKVDEGVVDEATVVWRAPGGPLPGPVHVGTVRLKGGTLVIARLEPGVEEGHAVRLEYRDGVPVAESKES